MAERAVEVGRLPAHPFASPMAGGARIHRVVYLSRASATLSLEAVAALYAHSRAKNRGAGITGLLLHDGGRFLQALEGPEYAVTATMAKIAVDPRHHSVDYLQRANVDDRQFSTWGMQLMLVSPERRSVDFLARVKAAVARVDDPRLQAAFIGFAVLGSRASGEGGHG